MGTAARTAILQPVATIAETRAAVARARSAGRTIGFVPTMGALHAGHVSLFEAAREAGAFVVASLYVNPTQFGPSEDFQQYPRTQAADVEACRAAGVDLLFAPSDAEMYPPGDQTRVVPGSLADTLCGPFRPSHFEGVCTVVTKLFNIVRPDAAYFGQKDAQQVVILRRMVEDLRMPVRIIVCPTVREADGLALSSRNAGLSPEDRRRAVALYEALCKGRDLLLAGERRSGVVIAQMRAVIGQYGDIRIDYLSVVDPHTLRELSSPAGQVMLCGAVRIGVTRLIDNLLVELPAQPD